MDRPTIDKYYLNIALEVSKRATCLRKHYGAVIVKDRFIVSTGYNGAPANEPHCLVCKKIKADKAEAEYFTCVSVHAEQNAIITASKQDMQGSTLYLAGFNAQTDEELMDVCPCEICLRLIKNAGISKVITNKGIIFERDSEGVLRRVNND